MFCPKSNPTASLTRISLLKFFFMYCAVLYDNRWEAEDEGWSCYWNWENHRYSTISEADDKRVSRACRCDDVHNDRERDWRFLWCLKVTFLAWLLEEWGFSHVVTYRINSLKVMHVFYLKKVIIAAFSQYRATYTDAYWVLRISLQRFYSWLIPFIFLSFHFSPQTSTRSSHSSWLSGIDFNTKSFIASTFWTQDFKRHGQGLEEL